jgi:hypothetical protein
MVLVMTSSTDEAPQATRVGLADRSRASVGGILLVIAVATAIAFLILSLVMGMNVSNRVDTIEERIPILASDDSQVVNALLELRVLTYWLAYPTTQPLVLEPIGGAGASQGVLRIADDGLSGIIMVAGMQELPTPQVYQVWLMDDDDPVLAGQMRVDPSGWGATTIYLENPLTDFDSIEVTTQREGGLGLALGDRKSTRLNSSH